MINNFKKLIYKKIYRSVTDTPEKKNLGLKFNFINNHPNYYFQSFGNKNKDKIFYVIKIYEKNKEGGGLFANLLFILNHLNIADKLKAIPIIDFENFINRYNQLNQVNGTKNSWLYYFKPVSKFQLKEVYKSKNVLITKGFFSKNMKKSFDNNFVLKKIFKKYVFIKNEFINEAKIFSKNNFKKHKILGVHFRGVDRIIMPDHPLPPTVKQMFNLVDSALEKKKFDKIFLVTDSLKYLELFKSKYKEKLIFRENSFRSNSPKIFHLKHRKNHRYKIGVDNIVEMLLLSKLRFLICSRSNLSQTAAMLSEKKFNIMEIDNGTNSKSLLIAQFYFYIKSFLPKIIGGFNNELELDFKIFK